MYLEKAEGSEMHVVRGGGAYGDASPRHGHSRVHQRTRPLRRQRILLQLGLLARAGGAGGSVQLKEYESAPSRQAMGIRRRSIATRT